jgi:hypothetical protein
LNECATFVDRPSLIQGCEENSLDNAIGNSGGYHVQDNDAISNENKRICCLWGICGVYF